MPICYCATAPLTSGHVSRNLDAESIPAGHGPHPAASPYDKRISEALGVAAFEVYQVELPVGAETVRHNHIEDRNEDVYPIVAGHGWVVVDDEPHPVRPGSFISVDINSTRFLRAGPNRETEYARVRQPGSRQGL